MKLSRMVGLLAGVVGSRFIGAGLGFLSQVVLARILPVADVGVVLLAMSAAAFASLLCIGGYAMLAMTQLPKLATHGRDSLLRAFHRVVLTDAVYVCVVLAVLTYAASYFFNLSHGQNLALLFGMLCAPASALMRYNSSIASSERWFKLAYVPDLLLRPALFLLLLLIAWGSGFDLHMTSVIVMFVAGTFAITIGQAVVLGHRGLGLGDFGRTRAMLVRPLRSRAVALTIVSMVALAFADIVTLVAGLVLPEADVAVVGITMRLAAIAGFVLQAGQMFVLPDFTQALVRRDNKLANVLLLRINLTTLLVVGAGLVAAIVLGRFALSIFGADYVRGAGLLVLFMVGQSIRALGGMNQHILSINGHQLRTAGACVVALAILVCMAVLLCKSWGIIGLGYAVVAAEVAWLLALAAQAQKLCGRRGDLLWLARHHVPKS